MVKYQRAPTSLLIDPSAPGWAKRFVLSLQDYFQAAQPQAPVRMFGSNKADLPPPGDWRGCLAVVPDQHALVVSDGTNWLTITLGGPI